MNRRGYTLIELLIVLSVFTCVLMTLMSLGTMVLKSSLDSQRAERSQVNARHLGAVLERALGQANHLAAPQAGETTSVVEGCSNAAADPGTGALAAIDASAPTAWFAVCQSGPSIHYHEGAGCPPTYGCGTAARMSFGTAASPYAVTFTRPAGSKGAVEARWSFNDGGRLSSAQTAFVIAAAAGGLQ